MATEYQTRDRGKSEHWASSRMGLRFSLFGGGIAWTVHILASTVTGEFGCRAGWGDWLIGGISMVSWLVLAVTVFALALVGAAMMTGLIATRTLQAEGHGSQVGRLQSQRFIARCSLITNALFAFIILVQTVPIFFYFRAC